MSALAELVGTVRWAGDNLCLNDGTDDSITLCDAAGHVVHATPTELLQHEVWDRVDAFGKKRITDALAFAQKLRIGGVVP